MISDSEYGLVFTPELEGLSQGVHGFHIHENSDCDATEENGKRVTAGSAGGHFDPEKQESTAHRGERAILVIYQPCISMRREWQVSRSRPHV